jgi:homoserine kinase
MLSNKKFTIKVPASTANLGPGFDSIGLALDLFLILEAEGSNQWEFTSNNKELGSFPKNEQHFICQVALQTAKRYGKELPPCKVKMTTDIPLARGLGSSASAIIAGIELADYTGNLSLSKKEKLFIATEMEGHPDNVGASLYGGLTVGCYHENEVELISFTDLSFEAVVVIPEEELLTTYSRGVLPPSFSRQNAVHASSIANLLVAAILSGNWELAGKMMERDRFHQPYRKPLVQGYAEIERVAKKNGAFGVALSGAGPSVICFSEKGRGKELHSSLEAALPTMEIKSVQIETNGSSVQSFADTCLEA